MLMNIKNDDLKPCDIKIDKDGVWFFRGAEMFRREFVNFFYQHLIRDETGRYVIELENDRCYIDVEDVPYIIKAVHWEERKENGRERILLLLSDDTTENLAPDTLWIGDENVVYCRVRNSVFDARFSRASYYQLAEYINYDEAKDMFYIKVNGNAYYLIQKEKKG